MEIWKDIEGYDGWYQVSNYGRVRSWINNKGKKRSKPKILSISKDGAGYSMITINSVTYGSLTRRIHRLVAKLFVPNPENKPEVNHIDGDKSNNRVHNLEWCTSKENQQHASERNLLTRGEKRYNSKLTKEDVISIRIDYKNKDISQRELAERHGVSQRLIGDVVKRLAWKHVK